MADETIFERILRRDIPATIIYEDTWVLAFRDVAPQAPTHVLVIPKRKLAHFSELQSAPPTEVGEFFARVAKVATQLDLDKDGYRIVINHGRNGQQSVPYLHAHILGGRPLTWPPG